MEFPAVLGGSSDSWGVLEGLKTGKTNMGTVVDALVGIRGATRGCRSFKGQHDYGQHGPQL